MISGWFTRGRSTTSLDSHGEYEHDADGHDQCEQSGNPHLMQPDEGQRREHHHDPLSEIENARGLEDQYESERDEGVEDTRDEALPQGLDEEVRRRAHHDERFDQNLCRECPSASS